MGVLTICTRGVLTICTGGVLNIVHQAVGPWDGEPDPRAAISARQPAMIYGASNKALKQCVLMGDGSLTLSDEPPPKKRRNAAQMQAASTEAAQAAAKAAQAAASAAKEAAVAASGSGAAGKAAAGKIVMDQARPVAVRLQLLWGRIGMDLRVH